MNQDNNNMNGDQTNLSQGQQETNTEPVVNAESTIDAGATVNAESTLNAGSTVNAGPTMNTETTINTDPVMNAGSTINPEPAMNYDYNSAQSAGANDNNANNKKFKSYDRQYARSEVIVLKKSTVSVIALVAVVVLIASAIGGAVIATGINSFGPFNAEKPVNKANYTIQPTNEEGTAEAVAKKVLDSVVGVTTSASGTSFFGEDYEATGQGTGMIVHSDGYILTNSHVVSDGQASKIEVLLSDGTSVEAKCLWYDADIDLAIIKVNLSGLTPVVVGDSDKIQIGSFVAAIGNPLGLEFNGSVTQGIVSGLNRSIVASSETGATRMEGLIQVDAAINPGNSGGPLLNNKGEVIGVNTAKASAEGMGFAIPINTAAPIIDKVIETGSFQRAYMGITTMNVTDVNTQYPEMKLDLKEGAFIQEVTKGSPADKAGLKMKDVVIAINDKSIDTSTNLIKELLNYSSGDTVEVKYIREGKEATTKVTLASQSDVYGNEQPTEEKKDESKQPNNGGDDPYGNNPQDEDQYLDDWFDEFW